MPTSFPRARVRIAIDIAANVTTLTTVENESTPIIWRGRDVQFEFALYYGDTLIDLTDWDSITLNIKSASDKKGDALAQAVIASGAFNNSLTDDQWTQGTAQHFSVAFTAAEMMLDMDNKDTFDLWLVLSGITTSPDLFKSTFGTGIITMQDDGTTDQSSNPALGASLIPMGATYDGSGNYTLVVTANKVYDVEFGPNDTSITNGTDSVVTDSKFTAQGTSLVFVGDPSTAVTATLRRPTYFTADESDARYGSGVLNLPPGGTVKLPSENGNFVVILGCDNDGNLYTQTQAI